jgi:hypothetical protein
LVSVHNTISRKQDQRHEWKLHQHQLSQQYRAVYTTSSLIQQEGWFGISGNATADDGFTIIASVYDITFSVDISHTDVSYLPGFSFSMPPISVEIPYQGPKQRPWTKRERAAAIDMECTTEAYNANNNSGADTPGITGPFSSQIPVDDVVPVGTQSQPVSRDGTPIYRPGGTRVEFDPVNPEGVTDGAKAQNFIPPQHFLLWQQNSNA